MSREKQVTKVIVYYSDGSYEELVKNAVWPSITPQYQPRGCMVCGEIHAEGMQCPRLSPGDRVWRAWGAGQEDPGK